MSSSISFTLYWKTLITLCILDNLRYLALPGISFLFFMFIDLSLALYHWYVIFSFNISFKKCVKINLKISLKPSLWCADSEYIWFWVCISFNFWANWIQRKLLLLYVLDIFFINSNLFWTSFHLFLFIIFKKIILNNMY